MTDTSTPTGSNDVTALAAEVMRQHDMNPATALRDGGTAHCWCGVRILAPNRRTDRDADWAQHRAEMLAAAGLLVSELPTDLGATP